MTTWSSKETVGRAVETLSRIFKAVGTVPADLVETYLSLAEHSSRAMRAAFWELLAEKCPELLPVLIRKEKKV